MVWINEADSARHIEKFKSSNSLFGRTIPDFEVLDSQIASAHKEVLTGDFKRSVNMEDPKAQQHNRFLNRRRLFQGQWKSPVEE